MISHLFLEWFAIPQNMWVLNFSSSASEMSIFQELEMEFLPPTRKGLPLQQLPQQRESLSLFCLQRLVISEANCPSLKGFIDPTAESKKAS